MVKKIHYCWFGGKPKPKKIRKCIASWKKYFPDFEIIEWNESNFDINCNEYVKNAYNLKKWAYVSDYCRLAMLYKYGGLYFDTDVEVIKRFKDEFFLTPFITLEIAEYISIGMGGTIYVEKDDPFCKSLLDSYEGESTLEKEEGSRFTKTICDRAYDYFIKYGFVREDKFQSLNGYTLYPTEYFSPLNNLTGKMHKTKNTYSIHYFIGSWFTFGEKLHNWFYRLEKKLHIK